MTKQTLVLCASTLLVGWVLQNPWTVGL